MVLAEIASIIEIAQFGHKIIKSLKKKKSKRKSKPRKPKQNKDDELILRLLSNPQQAIKEMGAEYVVKNRKRILRNIEKYVVDEL